MRGERDLQVEACRQVDKTGANDARAGGDKQHCGSNQFKRVECQQIQWQRNLDPVGSALDQFLILGTDSLEVGAWISWDLLSDLRRKYQGVQFVQ
jgi:hypothetical protein